MNRLLNVVLVLALGVACSSDPKEEEKPTDTDVVSFAVPAGGGSVTYGEGAQAVGFTFPASAAGITATISPSSATDIGWQDGQVESVLKLEPSGTVFADPIVIKPANGNLMAFVTTSDGAKGKPELLQLNDDGTGLELNHFSALVFVPPGKSCSSTSGWGVRAESNALCSAVPDSVYVGYSCKGYEWCSFIEAHCCLTQAEVDARADKACQLGDPGLTVSITPNDGNGQYAYCVTPCNALEVSAAPTVTLSKVAQAAPAPAGGTLVPGIYHLTSATEYTGVGGATGTGDVSKAVVKVTADTLEALEVINGQTQRWNVSWSAGTGNTLNVTFTCGRTGTQQIGYAADATTFKIYVGGGAEEHVYTLQP